jgi:hypothetical protein
MRSVISITALLLVATGCQDLGGKDDLATLDEPFFRCQVQPIVTKSCGMFLCHGDAARYYTVFTRNRLRFGLSEDERNATMTVVERRYAYDATRAHVDRDDPAQSLLLLKPLDESAGGYFHGGATEFGQGDVYLSTDEPDYQTLLAWINGATDATDCIEPGSEL